MCYKLTSHQEKPNTLDASINPGFFVVYDMTVGHGLPLYRLTLWSQRYTFII
jgi:hypothetical protein